MSTDFRVNRIVKLDKDVDNSLDGIRAIRAGAGMTYKLSRPIFNASALGAAARFTGGEVAITRDENLVAQFVGDGTEDTFSLKNERVVNTWNGKPYKGVISAVTLVAAGTLYAPGDILHIAQSANETCEIEVLEVDSSTGAITDFWIKNGGSGYYVYTSAGLSTDAEVGGGDATFKINQIDNDDNILKYSITEAKLADETYLVYVNGTKKTVTTDYTIANGVVTFVDTKQPTHGAYVEIKIESAYEKVTTSNIYVNVDGARKTYTTDYTLNETTEAITFEAGKIPAAGKVIEIGWLTDIPTSLAIPGGAEAPDNFNASGDGTLVVQKKTGLEGEWSDLALTTDYTIDSENGEIDFVSGHEPADGDYIGFLWEYDCDQINLGLLYGVYPVQAWETVEVKVGDTVLTEGESADYTLTDGVILFAVTPTAEDPIVIKAVTTNSAVVVAGAVTWFDTHKVNLPAYESIRPSADVYVEVM